MLPVAVADPATNETALKPQQVRLTSAPASICPPAISSTEKLLNGPLLVMFTGPGPLIVPPACWRRIEFRASKSPLPATLSVPALVSVGLRDSPRGWKVASGWATEIVPWLSRSPPMYWVPPVPV